MTRDDIIRMAELAGIKNDCDGFWCNAHQFMLFAAFVAAAEREACAKVCETVAFYDQMGPRDCADMIRARGEK